jgi:hypothetical protein
MKGGRENRRHLWRVESHLISNLKVSTDTGVSIFAKALRVIVRISPRGTYSQFKGLLCALTSGIFT